MTQHPRLLLVGGLLTVLLVAGNSGLVWTATTSFTRFPHRATSQKSSGAISGVVLDGVTHDPIPDAVIALARVSPTNRSETLRRQLTDAKGRFVFLGLGDDAYIISVRKAGYADSAFGRQIVPSDAAQRIQLRDGEWVGAANVLLWQLGSIAGTIVDELGEPLQGVYVRALARLQIAGHTQLAGGPTALTDHRGRYRISGLTPGRYIIMVPSTQQSAPSDWEARQGSALPLPTAALPPELPIHRGATKLMIGRFPIPPPSVNGETFGYPIAFSGAAELVDQATAMELASGQHINGVDLRLRPVKTHRVTGMVDAPPEAREHVVLRLLARGLETLGFGTEVAATVTAPDGTFVFENVPAGSYTLEAPSGINEYATGQSDGLLYDVMMPRPPGLFTATTIVSPVSGGTIQFSTTSFGVRYWGRTTLVVDGANDSPIRLLLRPALTVSGQIVLDDPARSAPPMPSITLDPASGSPWLGRPTSGRSDQGKSGAFTIPGVLPGVYWVRRPPDEWLVKSVTWSGTNHTNRPVDLTSENAASNLVVLLTTKRAVLTGIVLDARGQPARSAGVIAFPVDRDLWKEYGVAPANITAVSASDSGIYLFDTLPAGAYFVVAVSAGAMDAWRDPSFFNLAAAVAQRVSIDWGQTTTRHVALQESLVLR